MKRWHELGCDGAWVASPAAIAVAGGAAVAQTPSTPPLKAPVPPPPFTAPAARSEAGVRWQSLTPAQRQALAPLEREWSSIDAPRKQKWLAIADRYPSMPPQERTRITGRMNEWTRLTPAQRGEMRLRYQEAQQLSAPDRSAKWEEYQNLPPDATPQFADRAATSAAPRRPGLARGRTFPPPREAAMPVHFVRTPPRLQRRSRSRRPSSCLPVATTPSSPSRRAEHQQAACRNRVPPRVVTARPCCRGAAAGRAVAPLPRRRHAPPRCTSSAGDPTPSR